MSKSIIKQFVSLIFFLILSFSVYSIDWSNFQVFSGSTAPYASNGPGCKMMGSGSGQTYTVGQECPSSSPAYDLGAVWADLDNDYVAWMIYAPNMTDAGFCGGTKNSANMQDANSLGITVEFDSDSNFNTGCRMPNQSNQSFTGDMCFPGSEYRFYVWGDDTTSFEMYNRSLSTCDGTMSTDCFQEMNETLNPLYNVTFNVTCNTPTIVRVAINRSAITNLTGMTFQTNTLGGGGQPGPKDMLGGFDSTTGGFVDNFLLGGKKDFMSYSQHPCMQYDNTNQTICTTNPNNITGADGCGWDSFASRCNPNFDFRSQSCSEFCGACNTTSACLSGANGKCMVVAAPPQLPPDVITFDNSGTTSLCVDDFSKIDTGSSGNCDENCHYCSSNSTCIASAYPNPMGSGAGCKWVTDSDFGKSWCDLATFDISSLQCSANSIDRCNDNSSCFSMGGNWSSQFNVCYQNDSEICFNGIDDNNNGQIDCQDSACSKSPSCGGDVNVLTGGFGTLDSFDAMKKQMFQHMDPSPPVILYTTSTNPSLPVSIDSTGFMLKDMGTAFGIGLSVTDMSQSLLCTSPSNGEVGKYYFMVDSDTNLSTGCDANISDSVYSGFDYKFEYEIANNGTNGALEIRRGYRCFNNTAFNLFSAKIAGPPDDFGGNKISCIASVAIIAVDKNDMGSPKGNIRFMAATSDNATTLDYANDTIFGKNNGGVYYTPGSIDFKPKDCFSNPMACGTAFSVVGGGKYMPFEDCFLSTGDEDLDGLANCADSDCQMAPWCAGSFNYSADKTAPTMYSNSVDTFTNFVSMHWTTNKPTNSTVKFYSSCLNSTAINTIYELGDPIFTFDDYRPWHNLGVKSGTTDSLSQPITLNPETPYFYKITLCDKSSNCAVSGCLNFTTQSQQNKSFQYQFDFVPSNNTLINTTKIQVWNGSEYLNITPGEPQNQSNYLSNAKLKFENTESNWEIEFDGIDFAKALQFNLSSAFNVTNNSGSTYVGVGNQKWNDMVQNLGVNSILIKIPGTGTSLIKCNENNISDCSDVTSQATLNETGSNYTKWKIPTSLGFSVYGTTLSGVTLSSDKTTYKAYPYATAYFNLTNSNISLDNIYNLTINTTSLSGVTFNFSYYNSTSLTWVTTESNNATQINDFNFSQATHQFRVNISLASAVGKNWTINFTFFNGTDSVITLLDTAIIDSINLTYPADSASLSAQSDFNFTLFAGSDANQSCVLYINSTSSGTTNGINQTEISFQSAPAEEGMHTWYVSCTSEDGDSGISEIRSFTYNIPPTVTLNTPISGYNTSATTVSFNFTITDNTDTAPTCNLTLDTSVNISNIVTANNTPQINSTSGLNESVHTWNVSCWDDLGNVGNSTTRTFTVDNTAPALNSKTTSTNSTSIQSLIYLSANFTDVLTDTNSVWLVVNGTTDSNNVNSSGALNGLIVNFTYTAPITANTTINFTIMANDSVGNIRYGESFYVNVSDNIVPNITLIRPANNSQINNSYFSLEFNVTEPNPSAGNFCVYNFTNQTQYIAGYLTSSENTSGTLYTRNYLISSGITQFKTGSYNISVTCNDTNGNSYSLYNTFNISDTTKPNISSVSSSHGTTTFTITWNTDEYTNESVNYGATSGSLTSVSGDNTFSTSHSVQASGLSAGTTYYYNVTSCDINANCNSTAQGSVTTTASTTTTSSSSGGGGGATSTTEINSAARQWDSIPPGSVVTYDISNSLIPINKLLFTSKNAATSVTISVATLVSQPTTTSAISSSTYSKVYQFVQVSKTNIQDTDISSTQLEFKVPKTWLTTNNVSEDNVILLRWNNNVWNELSTRKIQSSTSDVTYIASSPGFSYFTIAAKTAPAAVTETQSSVQSTNTTQNTETTPATQATTTTTSSSNNTTSTSPESNTSSSSKSWIWIMVIIIILGALAVLYFYYKKQIGKYGGNEALTEENVSKTPSNKNN